MLRFNFLLNKSGFFNLFYADYIVIFPKNKYLNIANDTLNEGFVVLSQSLEDVFFEVSLKKKSGYYFRGKTLKHYAISEVE